MSNRLRILHLEDDPDFSVLVRDLLATDDLEIDLLLVSNQQDFEAALSRGNFDIILADYSLPGWNGAEALAAAQRRMPQTPFILVSGAVGEQAAIEILHAGATD